MKKSIRSKATSHPVQPDLQIIGMDIGDKYSELATLDARNGVTFEKVRTRRDARGA
jgi:hypothetical protein